MSNRDDTGLNSTRQALELPPWSECEVFCIHAYAGEAVRACGWRGRLDDASADRRICPRCGRATLMCIPSTNAE